VVEGQAEIDQRNSTFWNELCGSWLARQLGIMVVSPDTLARYDAAYMKLYPYLDRYLPDGEMRGQRLLEIGLGYGTVSQLLASRGFDYHGLDVAAGPVEMVRYRLAHAGLDHPEARVRVGSALDIPHEEEGFDQVVTIGCLHHTGDLQRAVIEVERVLRPGGRALVMLYNRRSYRRIRMSIGRMLRRRGGEHLDEEEMRGAYDRDLEGKAAPATEYSSAGEAKRLFAAFSDVRIRRENFDALRFGRLAVPRSRLLGWPARLAGLDLYITAIK
jgi:SAM-dependent methyltransferase